MPPYKKKAIPKAVRDQVWIHRFGKVFDHKCYIDWCTTSITAQNFECGHNIPESKGGVTAVENLYPVCSGCNKSMSNSYSIDDWNKLGNKLENKSDVLLIDIHSFEHTTDDHTDTDHLLAELNSKMDNLSIKIDKLVATSDKSDKCCCCIIC